MGSEKGKGEVKVIMAYIAVCILWGSTYLAIRIGVSVFPPALFAGFRFLPAGLLVLMYAKLRHLEFPKGIKAYGRHALVGILLLCGGTGLVVLAGRRINSGLSSLIVAIVPLYMALIEVFILKKVKLGGRGWFGLISGFSGVMLLVFSKNGSTENDIIGILTLMLAALFWATGSLYSKSFRSSGSTLSHIGIQMLSAGVVFCSIGLVTGELSQLGISSKGLLSVLYLIFFGSIAGYSSYIYVLKSWPAAKAGTYAYVNPVVAILLGSIILKEQLNLMMIAAAVIILSSVFVLQRDKITIVPDNELLEKGKG